MSLHRATYEDGSGTAILACEGCTQTFTFICDQPADVREHAAVHGWTSNGNHDHCPRCSA